MIKDNIKKNAYLYFFSKLLILTLIVFVLDFSVGHILRYFYFKQQSGLLYRTTYALEKADQDILIFGSSRANHHYHPEIFKSRMQQSYYNVGRDGQFIFYHYAVLKSVLKRYTPKMVILDLTVSDMAMDQKSYERLSALMPYYHTHPELRSIIELKSPFEKFKCWSSIYPFSSSIFTIAVGNTEFNKKRNSEMDGYVPLFSVWKKPLVTDTEKWKDLMDTTKIKMYESFIKDCVEHHVKLYIICSPLFQNTPHEYPTFTQGKAIAKKYNIDFFDYTKDTTFSNNPQLFADPSHLNDRGARIFSEMLVNRIMERGK